MHFLQSDFFSKQFLEMIDQGEKQFQPIYFQGFSIFFPIKKVEFLFKIPQKIVHQNKVERVT